MVSAGGGAENEDENIEGKRSIEYFLFFLIIIKLELDFSSLKSYKYAVRSA